MTTGKTIRVACARKLGFRLARGLSMKLWVEFWASLSALGEQFVTVL
jgi:hypothetical protein